MVTIVFNIFNNYKEHGAMCWRAPWVSEQTALHRIDVGCSGCLISIHTTTEFPKMCWATLQYRMLVVLAIAFASNDSVRLMTNSIQALKSIGKIPVFVRTSGVSSSDLYPWIPQTPISSLVARNECSRRIGGVRECYPAFSEPFRCLNSNVVLLVPSWPETVLSRLYDYITSFRNVPALVIMSPGNQVPGKPISCFLMRLSNTTMHTSSDKCLYIGTRANQQRLMQDSFQVQDRFLYPKNVAIVLGLHKHDWLEKTMYTRYPEVIAYLSALNVLNITPTFIDDPFQADVLLEPSIPHERMLHRYDIGGVYTCFGHGFFSSSVRPNVFHIISWWSMTMLLAAQILVGSIITFSFCLPRSVFPHSNYGISEVLLFLVSSSLGRSPVPLGVRRILFRVLLILWLLENIVISTYVQSQITSEYNVPAYLPAVETVEDLQVHISSGMVLPCVNTPYMLHPFFSSKSRTVVAMRISDIVERNWHSCVSDKEGCCKKARARTHVYIAPVDFAGRKAASDWGLRSGKEVLFTCCSVSLARRDFRYLRQHRRLVLSLAELGFTVHEERTRTWNHTKDSATTVTFPFSLPFNVLIYGCGGNCLIFLCELLLDKDMRLQHLGYALLEYFMVLFAKSLSVFQYYVE